MTLILLQGKCEGLCEAKDFEIGGVCDGERRSLICAM